MLVTFTSIFSGPLFLSPPPSHRPHHPPPPAAAEGEGAISTCSQGPATRRLVPKQCTVGGGGAGNLVGEQEVTHGCSTPCLAVCNNNSPREVRLCSGPWMEGLAGPLRILEAPWAASEWWGGNSATLGQFGARTRGRASSGPPCLLCRSAHTFAAWAVCSLWKLVFV